MILIPRRCRIGGECMIESEEELGVELKKLLARTHRRIRDEAIMILVARILTDFSTTRAGIGPGTGR